MKAIKWIVVASLMGWLSMSTVFAQTFTVEGRVVDDSGNGIAGVEVFLGLLDTTFEARYTCTDAEGYYAFTAVPDVPLISAVGPDVDGAETCSNAEFVADSGDAYVIQFYNGQDRSDARDIFSVSDGAIDYVVRTWDTGGRTMFNTLVVRAHNTLSRDFASGDLTNFYGSMNRIIRLAERFEDVGLITATVESSIITNADNYLTVGG